MYWKRLYGVAYRCVRDKTVAREVVQDVFVNLWQKRDRVSHIRDYQAYLLTCIKHRVYEYYEKAWSQDRLKKNSLANFDEKIHPVEEGIEYAETLDLINDELDKLPPTTRTIFKLSKFERYSNKEIANQMQVSSKAVEYHISRALKRLRIRLSHTPIIAGIITLFR